MAKKRILLAKFGSDFKDNRIKAISGSLRNSGMEIIYLGCGNTLDTILNAAAQEDPSIIYINIPNYKKDTLLNLIKKIDEKNLEDMAISIDSIVPIKDLKYLKRKGIDYIFNPNVDPKEITDCIKTIERKERKSFFQKLYEIFLSLE